MIQGALVRARLPQHRLPRRRRAGEPPALDLWNNFGAPEGHEFGRYETLHAMVRGGHAVIGGTVGGVDDGIVLDQDDPELLGVRITLKVTGVFKGDLRPGEEIPVGLGVTDRPDVANTYAGLMGDEGIFFIVPAGAPRPEFGITGSEPPPQVAGDWVLVNSQGVVIDDRGTAVFASNIVPHGFPATLDGIPFTDLKDRIQDIVEA